MHGWGWADAATLTGLACANPPERRSIMSAAGDSKNASLIADMTGLLGVFSVKTEEGIKDWVGWMKGD